MNNLDVGQVLHRFYFVCILFILFCLCYVGRGSLLGRRQPYCEVIFTLKMSILIHVCGGLD